MSYSILSRVFPFPCLFYPSWPVLSYPILDVFTSIPIFLPILLHLFFFLSYPILSFVSLPVSLLILSLHIFLHPFLPILSYPILSCPVLCFHITYCFFAHPILSYPLASHFFISNVILSYAFASRPVPLPILSFHIFCFLLSFPISFCSFTCPILSYILSSLFYLPFLFNQIHCCRIHSVFLHSLQFIPFLSTLSIMSAWILF